MHARHLDPTPYRTLRETSLERRALADVRARWTALRLLAGTVVLALAHVVL